MSSDSENLPVGCPECGATTATVKAEVVVAANFNGSRESNERVQSILTEPAELLQALREASETSYVCDECGAEFDTPVPLDTDSVALSEQLSKVWVYEGEENKIIVERDEHLADIFEASSNENGLSAVLDVGGLLVTLRGGESVESIHVAQIDEDHPVTATNVEILFSEHPVFSCQLPVNVEVQRIEGDDDD